MNKDYTRTIIFFSVLFFTFHLSGFSQTQEIGLRLSSFENFDFIYKKEKAENKLTRYRLGFANIGFTSRNDNESINFQFGFAIGVEKRRAINERLHFIHGIEPAFSFSLANNRSNTIWNLQPSLGYVLGFQYDFNEAFYVNVETIPSLDAGISIRDNTENVFAASAGFNSHAISATLAYRFTGKIRK